MHPPGDNGCRLCATLSKQREIWSDVSLQLRELPPDHVVSQAAERCPAHHVRQSIGKYLLECDSRQLVSVQRPATWSRDKRGSPVVMEREHASSGYRARASLHQPDIPEAPVQVRRGRRRTSKKEYVPSPSAADVTSPAVYMSTTSPRSNARPSPSCGTKLPNW